jgi:CubicO group peptidase (beta-lactamase class C family)
MAGNKDPIELIKNALGIVFPSAQLWVCSKGKVILNESFGVKCYGDYGGFPEQQVTGETIFDCASLTKIIATGTIAMRMFGEGKIDLEEPVCRTISSFNGDGRENVLLHHLLTHSSGLPAWKPYALRMINEYPQIMPGGREAGDLVLSWICEEKFEYRTGEMSLYSDPGFILFGFILEEKSGRSLSELFIHYVAEPLGLSKTFFISSGKSAKFSADVFAATEICPLRKRLLRGEVHDDNAYILSGVAGHAGIFSTAMEFGKWALEIRKGFKGIRGILKPETVRLFLSRKYSPAGSTRLLAFDSKSRTGSSAGKYFSVKSAGHLGFTGCSYWFDPARDLIVILLTNRVHPVRDNEKIKQFRPILHDAIVQMIRK